MIVHLFSTDPRPELLVSIMVPPDEGTPVSHYLLELDTHISRAETQEMSPDKLNQEVLYADINQSFPDKVREISIKGPTYGIMKLADLSWTEFYSRADQTFSKRPNSVVKFTPSTKKTMPNTNGGPGNGRDSHTGTGNNKGKKE
ncbi:hypothetical protein SARC_06802 [Sphaeroforma arctica JP610]|uniref:Uncharacterized protein n=1 Tax=Sphaeroforma arctica JP610 TaxID=667725 RepID=A0A0L0FVH2_9EUKA|nr:hypothetical protein SARC_06802 [Sphaeroforma arctica JP610]KNC80850.1 hypothetical protein SARC_06802 [Sphaeroforma arctica JP610]|eukprot:XP_014154752.1 hypothetical protein SARC_06802 [Sphaeroforma arctica JP610]